MDSGLANVLLDLACGSACFSALNFEISRFIRNNVNLVSLTIFSNIALSETHCHEIIEERTGLEVMLFCSEQ